MDKKGLEEYRILEARLRNVEEKITNIPTVSDVVRGSSSHFPYTSHPIKITGKDVQQERWLRKQRDSIKRRMHKIHKYIDSICDSEIRLIVQMRCVDGDGWEKIGKALMCDRTTVAKKYEKFLK